MFDPRQPYDLWLDSMADVPENERPTFTFRRMTEAEYLRFDAVFALLDKPASECSGEVFAALAAGLLGWKHQVDLATGEPLAFDAAKLSQTLDFAEAWQLIGKRANRARPGAEEKKNLRIACLIAAGKLCRDCKAGDLCPSPEKTVEVDCPQCDGAGCRACGDVGFYELTSCARRKVPRGIWPVLKFAELMDKGLPPVAGGVLDQDAWFVAAYGFVLSEKSRLEALTWKGD